MFSFEKGGGERLESVPHERTNRRVCEFQLSLDFLARRAFLRSDAELKIELEKAMAELKPELKPELEKVAAAGGLKLVSLADSRELVMCKISERLRPPWLWAGQQGQWLYQEEQEEEAEEAVEVEMEEAAEGETVEEMDEQGGAEGEGEGEEGGASGSEADESEEEQS